jgi:thioredoxin-dependent peroxiredoxin
MTPTPSSIGNLTRQFRVWTALLIAGLTITARADAPADFTVVSPQSGKSFRLADARGKYVALHFLLKTECPFCLRHTRDYATKSAGTPGVIHLFLKPDDTAEIQAWASKLTPEGSKPMVTVYRDPDAHLADQFGIPGGYQFHGQIVHYPALILLDPAGKEIYRYVGKSNSDRLSYDKFTAKLAEFTGGTTHPNP